MSKQWWENERVAGVLLHLSSLPGPEGCGTLGREARQFVDFLSRCGHSLWQFLPVTPPGCGNSPYAALSAFAGNPLLVDLRQLVTDGDLDEGLELDAPIGHAALAAHKEHLLATAARRFFGRGSLPAGFDEFCATTPWLDDFCLFMALRAYFEQLPWQRWPAAVRRREPAELARWRERLDVPVRTQQYVQWQFARQWDALHSHARQKGVRLFGDVPLFVAADSCDTWCHQEQFRLDRTGRPSVVAGVPPDCFAHNGQLWGNPHYDWGVMARDGYAWWRARVDCEAGRCDLLRIDHFRGLESAWEVEAGRRTAREGRWVPGPGMDLIRTLGERRLVAEDLGIITPEVETLRREAGLPGMRVLQFAFDGGGDNPHRPENHRPDAVIYSGTHDNNTTRGWFESLAAAGKRETCARLDCGEADVVRRLVEMAYASPGFAAITPLQDLLGLGGEHRMNVPGTGAGNWGWRAPDDYAARIDRGWLAGLASAAGRGYSSR